MRRAIEAVRGFLDGLGALLTVLYNTPHGC